MMDTNNVVINLDRFLGERLTDRDFYTLGLDMAGTFEDKGEFARFMMAIGSTYPEGIPWEYFWQRVESYRKEKLVEKLKQNGFVEHQEETGSFVYRIAGKNLGAKTY